MQVELQYFDDCPSWQIADEHLRALAEELNDVTVTYRIVDTPELAAQHRFRGSPSFVVDGVDPFAGVDDPIGLSCRIYQTPEGPAGSPTRDQLCAVLQAE